jgi:hypothetical protein
MRFVAQRRAPRCLADYEVVIARDQKMTSMADSALIFACVVITAIACAAAAVEAHSGPPFPVVSGQIVGPYEVSIWTDPDATDDGSAAGQFWVVVRAAGQAGPLPSETRVIVSVDPARGGGTQQGTANPVNGDVSRQFVALVMDHEGRYVTRASIDGPLGVAEVSAEVDATYDLRPSPSLVGIYLMPFVLIGFLWTKLLLRRRQSRARRI